MNRKVLGRLLESLGHKVIEACDGDDAVKVLCDSSRSKKPIDIVFMDIEMPRCDGIAATRQIRALPGVENKVPIFAVTAHMRDIVEEQVFEAGMNGLLFKPLKKSDLVACMADAIKLVQS